MSSYALSFCAIRSEKTNVTYEEESVYFDLFFRIIEFSF